MSSSIWAAQANNNPELSQRQAQTHEASHSKAQNEEFSPFECVIGLEVHAQLKTNSKMFSGDATLFEAGDNENTSAVSVGMPGALPAPNHRAIEFAIRAGLALGCQIRKKSVFARKNYFYPDLAKGYQISQFDEPLCEHGQVSFLLDGVLQTVSITRAHLEEDAGKSTHFGDCSLLNYNRSGVPLLEIVSGPDMHSPAQAAAYARTLRQILRYLNVCDGNLEEGSLRCDCNISLRLRGTSQLGTKVEIKNINSFRFVEKALEYEIERQRDLLERGQKIVQETRLWDPDKNRTFSMRLKEDADDYRYFPDPDLLPVIVTQETLEAIRSELPELPLHRFQRFQTQYQLPAYDAELLTAEKNMADFFETVAQHCQNPKAASNWVMTELTRQLNEAAISIEQSPISPLKLAQLIQLIDQGTISGKIAKSVFQEMWSTGHNPQVIIEAKGLIQISDHQAIEKMVEQVLASQVDSVAEFKAGKTKLFGFFVGQIMKQSKGQANPDKVNEILKKKLEG